MNKLSLLTASALLLAGAHRITADTTILASEFNRMFSNTNPLIIIENTTIELDEDIIINGEPIKAAAPFGGVENSFIFNTNMGNKVIIVSSGIWDLSTFNTENHIVQFTGDAEFILDPGATLRLNGGQLVMSDNRHIIPQFPE